MKKACARARSIAALSIEMVRGSLACAVFVSAMLGVCPGAFALDAGLDVSQYAHTAWKVRDGFARGSITSIAQTPDGYLWLGTDFGLYRFDGVRAVPWQPPTGEELPSTNITRLLVTRDGTLWIATRQGLVSWANGKLSTYADLSGHTIASLLEDHEGTIWAGEWGLESPEELCSIHSSVVECYGKDGSFGAGALSLYEDKSGNLWVAGGTIGKLGIWRWKPGPPRFYANQGLSKAGAHSFIEDTDGSLLIAARGIIRFDQGTAEAHPYQLPPFARGLVVSRFLRDQGGGLWIATFGGGILHVHDGRRDEFSESDGLSGNSVTAVFEDREGNVWAATNNGLDRFRSFATPAWSSAQGLGMGGGSAVLASRDGEVWAAVRDGLAEMSQGQITVYRRHAQSVSTGGQGTRTETVREVVDPQIPENGFGALFEDHSGRIWQSSSSGVGYLENHRFHSMGPLGTQVVLSIAEDTRGDLWASAPASGLFRLSSDGAVEKLAWAKLGHSDNATVLAADPLRGGLWAGFVNGGIVYFREGQVRASYTVADGLGKGRVADVRIGPHGTIWVSTPSGLSRVTNGHVSTLSSKNGLPCDQVWWSVEDDERFVWLYMPCGLVRIARSELDAEVSDPSRQVKATVFDESDGVRTWADFIGATPQASKGPDGRIWFSAADGVSVIDPRHLPYNKVPPPVQIEQITVDRKIYDARSNGIDTVNRQVRLPPLIRDLQIDYTALSLVAPEKVLFRYKLEGYDRDWVDGGNRRQAFYSNLPPRNYTFRVMACNNSGVWNEAGAFVDFSIAPAYYQTNWFRALCALAFLALLWGLYQLRLQQLAREFNMRLDARVSERTRIARELHDSLLQGFQGMMFRLQAVRDMLPGRASAEAIAALDIALERGDKAIAEGRDTVSDLREPIMGDSDIAEALTALGKELALQSGNGLVPYVRVLVEGKQRELDPVLRDEIYRIGREALRNAFRHAKAKKIESEITYGESEFLLNVRDDGIGIASEVVNEGSRAGHWGLPGLRERAKSFGGKVEVWSEQGAGTEIELMVPAAIAYGGERGSGAGRRFWWLRKKIGVTDGK